MAFHYVGGEAVPATKLVTITTATPASFRLVISGTYGYYTESAFLARADWLTATPFVAGATEGSPARATLTVGVMNLDRLTPGTYSGAIFVTTAAGSAALPISLTISPGLSTSLRFVATAPCRILETRPAYNFEGRSGSFGPPYLRAGETRTLVMTASNVCKLPPTARAFELNITAVPKSRLQSLIVFSGDEAFPRYQTLTSPDGQITANSAIVKAGSTNNINIYSSDDTEVLIDVSGYFTDDPAVGGLAFYPIAPCRAVDTRSAYRSQASPFGPPSLQGQTTRRFDIRSSPDCPGLANAVAYAATLTAVPQGPLQFITVWPSGSAQPNVSSINSPSGRIVANSVILPAGINGSIDVSAHNTTDLIIDITGYFGADDHLAGLFYTPMSPCRLDVSASGSESTRTLFAAGSATCPATASSAKALAINATSQSNGATMPFLTVYPSGTLRPNTSILNAFEGQMVANAAIVAAGPNASLDVYTYRPTTVTIELSGYFTR
ncbi:MAG: hypothetical protein HY820_02520 [Acidobacteria bacterium]|nr:hypothetical protein [Acidobacteriota bacterium]